MNRLGLRWPSSLFHLMRGCLFVWSACAGGWLVAAEPTIERLTVGLGNHFKVGCWTPVRIELAAGDRPLEADLELLVPDGDGLLTRIVHAEPGGAAAVKLGAGEKVTLVRYAKIGRIRGQLEARLVQDKNVLAASTVRFGEQAQPLYSTQEWIAVIGHGFALDQAFQRRRAQGNHPPVVTVLGMDELPTNDLGYDGLDAVVVTTSDPAPIRAMTAAQRQSLLDWVQLGGRLVLALGQNGAELAGPQGPLNSFVPFGVSGVEPPRPAPGLESFAHAEQPLPPITASLLEPGSARIVAYLDRRTDGQVPAIVRYALGFGYGTALSFDIDDATFANWDATAGLLSEILHPGEADASVAERDTASRRVTHIGYDEMVGQLRGALDYFPGGETVRGVAVVSFTAVMLLIGTYVLLIGPGDYFFLRTALRRMEWTWVTFPLVIVVTCVVIHQLGHRWRGGVEPKLKQVDLVDIDYATGTVRGTTWAQLYSPATRSFDLTLQPHWPLAARAEGPTRRLLTWQGLPGSGLGGFDTTAAEVLAPEPYLVDLDESIREVELQQLPVATGGSKSLFGRWIHRQPLGEGQVLTVDRNGFLRGTLQNILNVPLDDGMIMHGQFVYRMERSWAPGQPLRVDGLDRRDLQWRLTRRRILDSKTSYVTTPWDPHSREVPRILEIMMLHEAAGGQHYTGLSQRYQSFVDLSPHLDLGRAIIMGRVAGPVAELTDAAQSPPAQQVERWAWARLVVPVEFVESAAVEGTLR